MMYALATRAEVCTESRGNGKRVPYKPTVLVMMFDNAEQLAEYRRRVNGTVA